MRNAVTLVLGVLSVAILVFLFWIGDGFSMFQKPIAIVLPVSFEGVVCVEVTPPAAAVPEYVLEQNGYLAMPGNIQQSHRKRLLYRRHTDGILSAIPVDTWMPIYTENDVKNGKAYTVVWVGTSEGWEQFRRTSTPSR